MSVIPPALFYAGPDGRHGIDATKQYEHVQAPALSQWVVNHNLGREPRVSVFSMGGEEVLADVVHFSINQVRINFVTAFAGWARCV